MKLKKIISKFMEKGRGKKKCEKCGFRIRGKNHDAGTHHNGNTTAGAQHK